MPPEQARLLLFFLIVKLKELIVEQNERLEKLEKKAGIKREKHDG